MSQSPTPKTKPIMDFPAAIRQIINGKKITKLEWEDDQYYGSLENTILMLHKPDGKFHHWIINEGDLLGEDWIVLDGARQELLVSGRNEDA